MDKALLSSLIVDVKPGEKLTFPGADHVCVEFIHKSGKSARLRVTAPREVKIAREESAEVVAGMIKSAQ